MNLKKFTLWTIFTLGLLNIAIFGFIAQRTTQDENHYRFGNNSPDGIGKFYMGREISSMVGGHEAIEWLERQDRFESEKPNVVIKSMDLKPSDVIADIGAGSGYYTFRIAPLIAQGKIYAVEIGPEMLTFLQNKKESLKLNNVIVHEGSPQSPLLPPASIDLAFMIDAYHEFSQPREMMRSIVKSLKPGGRVLFVEYRGEDPEIPIKPLHKMTVEQLKKEMEAVGLTWINTNYELPMQHISIFRKP